MEVSSEENDGGRGLPKETSWTDSGVVSRVFVDHVPSSNADRCFVDEYFEVRKHHFRSFGRGD